jgi:hypothetical protein
MNKAMFCDSLGNEWEVTLKPKSKSARLSMRVLGEIDIQQMFGDFVREQRMPKTTAMKTHQGKKTDIAELEEVARVYLFAYERKLPVQQTVAELFDLPISTATKKIMKAREEGFIPLTSKSKRGRRGDHEKD